MDCCPKCQSKRVHASRTRSRFERMRRAFTGKSPFRCSDCGWRGWAFDFTGAAASIAPPVDTSEGEPDLAQIDAAIREAASPDETHQPGRRAESDPPDKCVLQ